MPVLEVKIELRANIKKKKKAKRWKSEKAKIHVDDEFRLTFSNYCQSSTCTISFPMRKVILDLNILAWDTPKVIRSQNLFEDQAKWEWKATEVLTLLILKLRNNRPRSGENFLENNGKDEYQNVYCKWVAIMRVTWWKRELNFKSFMLKNKRD